MNENHFEKTAEQAAALQKVWMDSMSKAMQAAFTVSPNAPPPEIVKNIRAGIFQALAESWDQFMRSPQFLEGMRQWMENAVAFRKMTNDFMARVRNDFQSPSREDVDSMMLTVRHMEKRLLDRIEELSNQVTQLNERLARSEAAKTSRPAPASPRSAAAAKPKPQRRGRSVEAV